MKDKMFIVRKFIKAKSAAHAIRKERKMPPDEVYLDEEWKKNADNGLASVMGSQQVGKTSPVYND